MSYLNTLDWIVIGIYFLLIYGVAFFTGNFAKKSSEHYFLAGRNMGWFVIGCSLFASNIGSEHIVGLAGTGFDSGLAVSQFEILACFILILLGWFFAPFYIKNKLSTMPEFLEKRYDSTARWFLSILSILSYVLTKIAATIMAGGIVFQSLMGIDFWTGAFIVIIATGLYTIIGGLRAVLYTDVIQMFILLIGSIIVTVVGFFEIGGLSQLYTMVEPSFMSVWRPMSDPNFPWTGILFGAPILGVWYWCTDQYIVQRILAASNINEARKGSLFGSVLKLLPMFIFVFPGVIAYCLVQQGAFTLDQSDHAFPVMVGYLLSPGFKGIVVAGLLAALMSSLSSVFNACSTLLTYDIYKKLNPEASDKRLVLFGQFSTLVLVVIGILWVPLMDLISAQLFTYVQSIQAYIAPPIAVLFIFGILSCKVNAFGAKVTLYVGSFLGILRLTLELFQSSLSGVFLSFATINFLHFAFWLFVVCSGVLIIFSFLSRDKGNQDLTGLTMKRIGFDFKNEFINNKFDVGLSICIVMIVFGVWLFFS